MNNTLSRQVIAHAQRSLSGVSLIVFVLPPDVFDLSLSDCCLQENDDSTTENGINPELAKVGDELWTL